MSPSRYRRDDEERAEPSAPACQAPAHVHQRQKRRRAMNSRVQPKSVAEAHTRVEYRRGLRDPVMDRYETRELAPAGA
jgi:hypothetical protein